MSNKDSNKSTHYRQAGVDLDAAQEVVERYKTHVDSTQIPGVLGHLGGFGGLFSLKDALPNLRDPILVSGTDGVGTKLKIAFDLNRHDTIGIDLVAMCVNDIITSGAKPLFFLDYLATGKLEPDQAEAIIEGISKGCKMAGCALIGGETAEMPGFYAPKEYDVAGFVVGIVERSEMLSPENVSTGDLLIGVESSGFHSNGYSLVRHIIESKEIQLNTKVEPTGVTLGELLLEPTKIYTPLVLQLLKERLLLSAAHITGGGLYENIPRILPQGLGVTIDPNAWDIPPVIQWIAEKGELPQKERFHVFNMGLGLVLVVKPEHAAMVQKICADQHVASYLIGEVIPGKNVHLKGIDEA